MAKTAQEELDELKGHHAGVMQSLTTLQTKLDAALQKEIDDRSAHAAELGKRDADHAKMVDDLVRNHRDHSQAREEAHAVEIAALKQAHADAMAKQAANLTAKHAAELAALKEKVLIPAQRDLQQRQLADLAARHKAELDALK